MSHNPFFSSVPKCGQPCVTQGLVFADHFLRGFGDGGAEVLVWEELEA